MDFLNKAKAALGGNKSHTTGATGNHGTAGGQKDYGDKAINAVQAKFGIDKSGKYDKYEEKGSDMLRGQFEKATGKKVSGKFSN